MVQDSLIGEVMVYTTDTLYDRLIGQYGFDPGDLDDFFRVNSKRQWLTYINKGETDVDRLADVIHDWLGYIDPIDESMQLSEAKEILKENGFILEKFGFEKGRYCIMNKKDGTYFTGMGADGKCFPWTDDIAEAHKNWGDGDLALEYVMDGIENIVYEDGHRLGLKFNDLCVVDTKTGEIIEYKKKTNYGSFIMGL